MNIPERVGNLSRRAKFEALAEEAGELEHAAQKVQRILNGENPTPVPLWQALRDVREEVGDVWCCLAALELDDLEAITTDAAPKMQRWEDRLREAFG